MSVSNSAQAFLWNKGEMKRAQVQKHSVALNIKRSLKNNTGDVKAINYNKVQ